MELLLIVGLVAIGVATLFHRSEVDALALHEIDQHMAFNDMLKARLEQKMAAMAADDAKPIEGTVSFSPHEAAVAGKARAHREPVMIPAQDVDGGS